MASCYAHRAEVNAHQSSRWEQTQRPTTDKVQSVKDFGALSPKWIVFIKPLPPEFRELCRRGSAKKQRWWESSRHRRIDKHTMEIRIACTTPALVQSV